MKDYECLYCGEECASDEGHRWCRGIKIFEQLRENHEADIASNKFMERKEEDKKEGGKQ